MTSSQDEIRQAYLDLVRVWHPDRFNSDARLHAIAEEKLKEITEAYRTLSEPGGSPPAPDPGVAPVERLFWKQLLIKSNPWFRTAAFAGLFISFLYVIKIAIEPRPQPHGFAAPPPMNAVEAAAPEIVRHTPVRQAIPNIDPRDSSGAGEFLIRNNTGSDCSVRMVRTRALNTAVRQIEIPAGSEASIDAVPTGIYKLQVSIRGAAPDEYSIGPFQFVQTQSGSERRGDKYTVILSVLAANERE